ncbi:MAG: hypothetical protein AAGD32_06765 [Planctomycetota bacterium]
MRKSLPLPLLVAVLVLSLLASGLVRSHINHRRADVTAGQTLARLDSFALGLLLGGFRGPLTMMLWTSTENQKTARDLADFDTKLELIRMLQPQFDSVHIYQSWNKAYNQSAQVASLPTKYAIILDAIDYAQDVDAERRPDVDIKEIIGQVYFQKLGLDNNRVFYDQRLRKETKATEELVRFTFPTDRLDEFRQTARAAGVSTIALSFRAVQGDRQAVTLRRSDAELIGDTFDGPGVERETRQMGTDDRHASVLDADGQLLPAGQLPNGRDLAHLRPFGPFPYGVPAHAFAYDYFSQALMLQIEQEQKHAQLSPRVISARPALALREWAEGAFEQARVAELEYVNAPEPETSEQRETFTAEIPPTGLLRTALFDETLWQTERVIELLDASSERFAEHIDRFPGDRLVYLDDLTWMSALRAYAVADAAYLRLTQSTDPAERSALARQARESYAIASVKLAQYLTRYHTEPFILTTVGLEPGRFDAGQVPADVALDVVRRSRIAAERDPFGYEFTSEAQEFGAYLERIGRRLELLDQV